MHARLYIKTCSSGATGGSFSEIEYPNAAEKHYSKIKKMMIYTMLLNPEKIISPSTAAKHLIGA